MLLYQPIQRNAKIHGSNIATQYDNRSQTWAELKTRVAKLASGLSGYGVKPGDRIAMLALNSDYYYEYYFAMPWGGYIAVPLNIRWSLQENLYSIEDSESQVLFVDDTFLGQAKQMQQHIKAIRLYVYMGKGETPPDMISYEQLIGKAETMEPVASDYEDLTAIFYTGGTTGFPKGVMLNHRNIWSSSISVMAEAGINQSDVNYLHVAPMFHIADYAISMACTISGARHTFIPAFDADRLVAAVDQFQVTHTLLVPTMINMLLTSPTLGNNKLRCLKKIIYGASPMPEGTLREAMKRLSHVDFVQAYGQTELAPVATILPAEYHVLEGDKAAKLSSAGRPVYGVDIEIRDPLNQPLPTGKVGEVAVRGANTMMGYLNKPEQTAKAMQSGWIMTGDAGYLDEDGFLFLVDRLKDMIVSGGENVFSAEVENALSKHPAVHEVVVIGIPSEQWGEAVHAIVRQKPGQLVIEEKLIDFCKGLIADYKCPRSVEFREQPFPITGAGKIRKVDLRKPYWEKQERMIN